jgi:hypothetical protein
MLDVRDAPAFRDNHASGVGNVPERASYGSFFYFNDPDGNTWLAQEVTTRFPRTDERR